VSRIFLSHASADNREAIALNAWLIEAEPGLAGEIFLDLDRHTGIPAGVRWKEALRRANERCEAVICLLSDNWDASHECKAEYRNAEDLHKPIFAVRLQPLTGRDITSEWQRCDLFGDGPKTSIPVGGESRPVEFLTEGLLRLRDGLRAAGIGADTFAWPPAHEPDRAPYRGWQPLQEVDAAVYFGRDAQIGRALNVIRGLRSSGGGHLFVVLGPSGVGKSSFLRAGLLPRLRRDDRHFLPMGIVRPQRNALTGDGGLAQSIHELRAGLGLREPGLGEIKNGIHDINRVRSWLTEAQQAAQDRVLDPADRAPATLVLPIDQAEELFGVDAGEQASALLDVLSGLLDSDDPVAMIVIATVRADRYEPLQTAPQLAAIQVRPFDDLKPMPQAQFKEVICGPARRAAEAGSRLAIAPELVDRLLDDWSRGADTLPLLSLTLARLYQDYGGGEITLAEYNAMGGLRRVVQSEVDELLAADPVVRQRQLDILRSAFVPWLATINADNDQPMRRVARWSDLPAESHPLLEAFIARRLLVRDERDGEVVVEVALESLLRQWDALAEWLRVEAADLKDADNLERAARAWTQNGCRDEWLLPGSRLADAESLAATPGFRERLNPTREFLLASRQREDQRLAEERRRNEADLQAARDREEAAKALAAAESQAKEEAQRHASVLRRRNWILRGALALMVVAAVVAGFLYVRASRAEEEAAARSRNAAALALIANAQLLLSGTSPGVSDDVLGMQLVLAARSFPAEVRGRDLPLLTALSQERSVLKIIKTYGDSYTVVFSPDGKRLAVADGDSIGLWNTETWQPIGDFMKGHKKEVMTVAFSPDGKRIISGSVDGTVRLWDAASRQPIGEPMLGHKGSVSGVAFSPDGLRIVSGSGDGTVRLWDAESRQPIGEPMRGHTDSVSSVAFSPDGRLIASGSLDTTLRLWDPDTRLPAGEPLTGSPAPVMSVAFSPDGRRIASADGTTIRLWDVATRTPAREPIQGHSAPIDRVVYSRDGTRIASASDDKTVRLWDALTGSPIGEPLVGHEFVVTGVAFDADGRRIVSSGFDKTFRVWDARGGQVFRGHEDAVTGVGFSPDGHRIVSSGADQTIRQWDIDAGIQTGPIIRVGGDGTTGGSPEGIAGESRKLVGAWFSADGRQIMGIGPRTNRAWEAATGRPLSAGASPPPDTVAVTGTDVGPKFATLKANGAKIAGIATGTDVQIRNAAMQPIGNPLHHDATVATFAFSPDGQRIATGSRDWQVRLWDANTGQPIGAPLEHDAWIDSIDFSDDAHTIAVAAHDGSIRLWNVETGEPIGEPMWQDGWVTDVKFSPDGHIIATGGADGGVRLFDVQTRSQIGSALVGHTQPVSDVEFSPDGTKVASAGPDKTIRVWPVPTPSPEKLCEKMTYNMSPKTWDNQVGSDIPYRKLCEDLPVAQDG
jgi:WD40 repeat protein